MMEVICLPLDYSFVRTYAELLDIVGANGRSPLQMVYNLIFCVSPVCIRKLIFYRNESRCCA
ncbi:MAG: hypothetical protein F6K17_16295 [Okeania sp. SIO3C4]|nr:hypothetical protein [Okeania sp. SIO3B3]NER04062.1 hypothetical protein [Okeania sp. SIO3C4]